MKMRSYYLWLLPVLALCVIGLIFMLVLDSRMASLNRSLGNGNVQVEVANNANPEAADNQERSAQEAPTADSSTDNVAEIQESSNNLAESASSAAQETSTSTENASSTVSFDLGQSLTDTLDSSLNLINGIDSEESARAVSDELSKLTETLTGFVTLSDLLPEASQAAVASLAQNASSSFEAAFASANSHEGVEALLAAEQEKFMSALSGLE